MARLEDRGRIMRSRLGGPFVADASVPENCAADLVSAGRKVGRAYDDPWNFAALRLTKEMYPRAGTLGTC